MEPGREDREHEERMWPSQLQHSVPQWNPAVKTGSTLQNAAFDVPPLHQPQWNPAVKTGSTHGGGDLGHGEPHCLNGTRP